MTGLKRVVFVSLVGLLCTVLPVLKKRRRERQFERGRRLGTSAASRKAADGLRWGNLVLPRESATQHFLAVGTTGSGKTLVQRLLMRDVLSGIQTGTDARALVLDAKNDMPAFLKHVGTTCPVYTLNPFDARTEFPNAVAWDVAADISSPARALNLASAFIPAEGNGNNRYFTDAARQVVAGVIESFIRHSPLSWSFSDLVFGTLCIERMKEILARDSDGGEVLKNFLGDERTGYQVFTTVVSRMAYFRPVAAMWQRASGKLSLKHWVSDESVLLLGVSAMAKVALDALNDILFRIVVEEIDSQPDSPSRRTWVWIDEARLSGPLLKGEMLPYLAVKGRSRGVCLVLAFQDVEGFREAAGPRVAHEIIAQCSHKALLRLETDESAMWASRMLGQYETLQVMRSDPAPLQRGGTRSEHVARKDAVLPSEFYLIPPTTPRTGITGFFISPNFGALRTTIPGKDAGSVVVPQIIERETAFLGRAGNEQWLEPWSRADFERLGIANEESDTQQQSRLLRRRVEHGKQGHRTHSALEVVRLDEEIAPDSPAVLDVGWSK
jgi:type IV secretory pathway TraG/TraD family ATPase VirD4